MSVECRIFVGLTIELERDLDGFEKCHALEEKYPELDMYNYGGGEREGKLLLIYDGMCGEFARLIKVDKIIDEASLGEANEFVELPMPGEYNPEITNKMAALYEEYTGKPLDPKEYKYAMWSQWY